MVIADPFSYLLGASVCLHAIDESHGSFDGGFVGFFQEYNPESLPSTSNGSFAETVGLQGLLNMLKLDLTCSFRMRSLTPIGFGR